MGISPTQLIIILVIVALLFGTKKLRNMGGDIGGAVRGFKKAMSEDDKQKSKQDSALIDAVSETITVTEQESIKG